MSGFGNSTFDQIFLVKRTNSSITTNETLPLDMNALVYAYNRSTLLYTYYVVIGLTLICVAVGLITFRSHRSLPQQETLSLMK
ncbi:hypothetical protein DL98DRAFT_520301 [Cadophora sp. DSE1049]|nr:hypothetical protein DL98DRAFT_520301 [Cadophora sp. DSE1049]